MGSLDVDSQLPFIPTSLLKPETFGKLAVIGDIRDIVVDFADLTELAIENAFDAKAIIYMDVKVNGNDDVEQAKAKAIKKVSSPSLDTGILHIDNITAETVSSVHLSEEHEITYVLEDKPKEESVVPDYHVKPPVTPVKVNDKGTKERWLELVRKAKAMENEI